MANLTVVKSNHKYHVSRISRADCEPYLLQIHYARRWPLGMTYRFGLFRGDKLCGVITYGETTSAMLRIHVAGLALEYTVIELTRLCLLDNLKNEASMLVGRSIKLLPKNKIIVSFADTSQDHIGCVYQATNFLYTGLSVPHKALQLKSRPNVHEISLLGEFKGQDRIREAFREKYKGDYYYKELSRKHRYIYIHGTRKFKKKVLQVLKYKPRPFPKRGQTIEDLENMFKDQDNLEATDISGQIKSSDFADLLI